MKEKNGASEDEVRKAQCRVQKAAYDLGFKLLSNSLQKATRGIEEWVEEQSH
jgi:hypothetical protein